MYVFMKKIFRNPCVHFLHIRIINCVLENVPEQHTNQMVFNAEAYLQVLYVIYMRKRESSIN